ncbi:MAG: hypothetical protein KJO88_04850 [Gammaproteobacteria bacterium]|nr:hypothetical protein [Gammaproteobacteria bacterium]
MLLRRITKHVKDQNWFAVALDFIIVVFGVFIGIQVANWNEYRADRQLGANYTQRLISDLQEDLEVRQWLSSYFGDVLSSVQEADRLLSESDPDMEALIVAVYRASEYNASAMKRATWNEIVSVGHLGLLSDTAIKSGIADYFEDIDQELAYNIRLFDSPYRATVRSLIPLPVQLAFRDGCSDVIDDAGNVKGFVGNCALKLDDSVLKATAETLKSSQAVRETLRQHYSTLAIVIFNHESNIVLIEEYLNALTEKDDR